jgi:hypothetical protein
MKVVLSQHRFMVRMQKKESLKKEGSSKGY